VNGEIEGELIKVMKMYSTRHEIPIEIEEQKIGLKKIFILL